MKYKPEAVTLSPCPSCTIRVKEQVKLRWEVRFKLHRTLNFQPERSGTRLAQPNTPLLEEDFFCVITFLGSTGCTRSALQTARVRIESA